MAGLKFDPGGPVLPFELITSQEKGEVVFLCGAGISMGPPVGLPGFAGLVRNIYNELGEDWSLHPGEAEGMNCPREYLAPDRTLNALFKRLPHQKPRILEALRKALSTGYRGTRFHHDLLRLSRGLSDVRIVTTNFDTLFERSWFKVEGERLTSYAVSGMPGPGSAEWKGVFHLHGRLADTALNYSDTQLVLTSAQFGDAYLRSGWASRYLYDLLRHANVVIIGYSLNDPPLRYLIDALDADRERFDFKALYSIAPIDGGDADRTSEIWAARGATPLLYDPVDPASGNETHLALRRTIHRWAEYAEDPTQWAKRKLQAHFHKSIDGITAAEWDEIDWVLSRSDNGRLLQEANPNSRWLAPLLERSKELQSPVSFGPWISGRLNDRDMIDSVVTNRAAITPEAGRLIEWMILREPGALSSTRRSFWLAMTDTPNVERRWRGEHRYRVRRLLSAVQDTGYFTRQAIINLFRPEVKVSRRWLGSGRRGNRLRDIANIEFEAEGDLNDAESIRELWPADQDPLLALDLAAELSASLRRRTQLIGPRAPSVFELPSIRDHRQNAHHRGFAPLVRMVVSLIERMRLDHPSKARAICERWRGSDEELEKRMWLHALSLDGLFGGAEAASCLLKLTDGEFWDVRFEREVLQLIQARRNDIDAASWTEIEDRLLKGPPQ